MTPKKITITFLFLCLQAISYAHASTFIMWAEGQGENLKDAKASAVSALSQQVISKVESSFRSEVSVNNDNVDRDMKSIKQIKSNLILKGVQYVDEAKDGNNIRITAGLDRAAIHSTIDYMKKQLDVDYSILSTEKKEEALVVSDQLTAFISVLPGSVLQGLDGIESWNNKKRDLLLKSIYMGQVIFVSPVQEYEITIDEKQAVSGDYFKEGSYEFTASADSYRTITGRFSVSVGESIKVKLPFIKAVSNKSMSLTIPKKYLFLEEESEETLSDLGISIKPSATNSLIIKIKANTTEVEDFVSHQLKVRIEAYKNDERVKKVTIRKNLITEQNADERVNNTIRKLVRKGTIALMSKIDLEDYFN